MLDATHQITKLFKEVVPVFLVDDVVRTAEYYRDTLGFMIDFLYGEPPFYAGVHRGNVSLHLNKARMPGLRHYSPAAQEGQRTVVNVFVTDVDSLYEELKANGAGVLGPPQTYPYGMRDFSIMDCNGYVLCFGEEVSETSGKS